MAGIHQKQEGFCYIIFLTDAFLKILGYYKLSCDLGSLPKAIQTLFFTLWPF